MADWNDADWNDKERLEQHSQDIQAIKERLSHDEGRQKAHLMALRTDLEHLHQIHAKMEEETSKSIVALQREIILLREQLNEALSAILKLTPNYGKF